MLIGAHRGAFKDESPVDENSLSAFKRAIEYKCDYIEFDVHKTIDGRFVIHHDNDIIINGNEFPIKTSSWNNFLEDYTLPITNERIPLLEEVITNCKNKIKMNIEVKDPAIGKEVVNYVLSLGLDKNQFFISSFHDSVLTDITSNFPDIYTGLLFVGNFWSINNTKKSLSYSCKSINPYYRFLTKRLKNFAKKNGLEIHTWTVNGKNLNKILLEEAVTSVITNDVLLALELRDKLVNWFHW